MSEMIFSKHFDKAEELMSALSPWSTFYRENELKKFIFRGQADSNYKLTPSALRDTSQKNMIPKMNMFLYVHPKNADSQCISPQIEYQLIRDFYRQADMQGLQLPASRTLRNLLYEKTDIFTMANWDEDAIWLPDDMLEAAALAQHYGVPTRLLDWSYSPFIAAFFATTPALEGLGTGFRRDGNLCIWGFNRDVVSNMHQIYRKSKSGSTSDLFPEFPLKIITPPYNGNPNLAAQQGLFTHWSTKPGSINSLIYNKVTKNLYGNDLVEQIEKYNHSLMFTGISKTFLKLTLPNAEAEKIASYLRQLGYGPSKLFPGYQGVSFELNERIHFERKPRE